MLLIAVVVVVAFDCYVAERSLLRCCVALRVVTRVVRLRFVILGCRCYVVCYVGVVTLPFTFVCSVVDCCYRLRTLRLRVALLDCPHTLLIVTRLIVCRCLQLFFTPWCVTVPVVVRCVAVAVVVTLFDLLVFTLIVFDLPCCVYVEHVPVQVLLRLQIVARCSVARFVVDYRVIVVT